MIKIIEGNIVNAKTDFIIHQVNCQGVMGSGVAKALRDYDEGIYKHYRKFCEFCKFEPEELLGTCDAYLLKDRGQIVLSLFAQNNYGYDGKQYTDLEAFRDGLRYISQHYGLCGKTDEDNLGFPYEVLDRYLRTGEIDNLAVKAKIDLMHKRCLFKSEKIPVFNPELKVEAE